MKKIILLGIAFFFSLCLIFASSTREMTVKEKTGNENLYNISNIKKITFSLGNMQILNETENDQFAINDIQHIRFSNLLSRLNNKTKPSFQLTVFPNPTEGVLSIVTPSEDYFSSAFHISIFSVEGRVVQTSTHQPDETQIELDVSSIPPGLYYLIIKHNENISSETFVKQ